MLVKNCFLKIRLLLFANFILLNTHLAHANNVFVPNPSYPAIAAGTSFNLSTLLASNVGGSGAGGVLATTDVLVVGDPPATTSTGNITLIVDASTTIANVQLGCCTNPAGGYHNGILVFNSGNTLTVTTQLLLGTSFGGTNSTGSINMTSGGYLKTPAISFTNIGTFTPGSGTIEFTGTNTLPNNAQFATFNNLVFSAGTTTLSRAITLNGNLTLSGTGILDVSFSNYQITMAGIGTSFTNNAASTAYLARSGTVLLLGSTTVGGTALIEFYDLTISGTLIGSIGHTIAIYDNWTNNGTFTHGNGTVCFTAAFGSIAGSVKNQTFYNLNISGTRQFQNGAITTIMGDLYSGTYTTVGGTTYNSAFSSNSDTFIFSGTGAQQIYGNQVLASLYNVTVNKPSGTTLTLNLSTGITVSNLLTMTSGTFDTQTYTLTGGAGLTATGGDLQIGEISGGSIFPRLSGTYNITGGTITFKGNSATNQVVRNLNTTASNIQYYNLVITGGGTGVKQLNGATYIKNDLTITATTLDVTTSNYAITIEGNWINNSTFTPRNGTVTFTNTTNAETISGSTTTTFYNLTENKSSNTLALNVNAVASNALTLTDGPFILNTNSLTVTNAATTAITRANNGRVVTEFDVTTTNGAVTPSYYNTAYGSLVWATTTGSYVVPFGASSTNTYYIPLVANIGTTGMGNLRVSTYHTSPGNLPAPSSSVSLGDTTNKGGVDDSPYVVDRYWYISSGGLAGTGTFTFTYDDHGAAGDDINSLSGGESGADGLGLRAEHWNNATLLWSRLYSPAQSFNTVSNTVIIPSVAGSSLTLANAPWALALHVHPLPILLLNFNVSVTDNDKANITWQTAQEVNNKVFIVERSGDGVQFSPIATVNGRGNSSIAQSYTAIDDKLLQGVSYYRLKQIDYDGNYSFSNIVSLNITGTLTRRLQLFPNPTTANTSLAIAGGVDQILSVNIYNILGKLMLQQTIHTTANESSYELTTGILEKGIYWVSVNILSNQTPIYIGKLVKD